VKSTKTLLNAVIFLTALSVTNVGETAEINIASASNFGDTLQKLVDTFYKATLVDRKTFNIILASTGKHTAQINRGAPFDIFLSADKVGSSIDPSLVIANSEFTYAKGILSLVFHHTLNNFSIEHFSQNSTFTETIDCLAIANPNVAPYGKAGLSVAESLKKSGLRISRVVQGQSVAQAFQFFYTGACTTALVAHAQVISLENENSAKFGSVKVPQRLHLPIQQNAILLKRAKDKAIAVRFMKHLKSDEAGKIIRAAGYLTDIQ
jgi:molybdate transport system substrate-binding protein